jgi:hypothetical protein
MAFSYPGKNVFECTDDEKYYTSRKRVERILVEGVEYTTANVPLTLTHGLGYKPRAKVFAKSNVSGQRFKLPRYFPTSVQLGPEGDTLLGDVKMTSTQLSIITTEDAEIYYRIFIDELLP